MKFSYNKRWEEELLMLGFQKHITDIERAKLGKLIEKVMYASDVKLIKPLIIILKNSEHLLGQVQSIYNTLEYTNENDYYRSLFSILPNMIDNNPSEILNCLAVHNINDTNITPVMDIMNELLSSEEQSKIANLMKEYNCITDTEYSFFYSQLSKGG